VVDREGVDIGRERSPDAAPGGVIPAADVLTEVVAADFVPISPRVEIAVVDPEGVEGSETSPRRKACGFGPVGAVPAAEAETVSDPGAVSEKSPDVELAVVDREGSNITRTETSRPGSDGAPGGAVPSAEFGTDGQAVDPGERSPHIELALVHRDGVDLTVELPAGHRAPVRGANHPVAVHRVELGLDPVLVASHRADSHLIEGAVKQLDATSA